MCSYSQKNIVVMKLKTPGKKYWKAAIIAIGDPTRYTTEAMLIALSIRFFLLTSVSQSLHRLSG